MRLIVLVRRVLARRAQRRRSPLRMVAGVVLALCMIGRPVHLSSIRWWRSHEVATAIGLTERQRATIEHLYTEKLAGRLRCIERIVEATNRVEQLNRDGAYDDTVLRETQALEAAAAAERLLRRDFHEAVASVLDLRQRQALVTLLPNWVE